MDGGNENRRSDIHNGTTKGGMQSASGWDGKLRVDKQAIITNPEALSDPEYSDVDAPPVEQIAADEGKSLWDLLFE